MFINPDQMFINSDQMFINPDQMFTNPDQMFINPDQMFDIVYNSIIFIFIINVTANIIIIINTPNLWSYLFNIPY